MASASTCLLILASLGISQSVKAATAQFSCGGGQTYTVVDGVITTTSGNCSGPLVIDSSVNRIADWVFFNMPITSVVIPDSVTDIGVHVFHVSPQLESAVIGNGVTRVGSNSFSYSSNLTSVTLGNHVESIEHSAFYLTKLSSITIPRSVKSLSTIVFANISTLQTVTFEDGSAINGSDGSINPTVFMDPNGETGAQTMHVTTVNHCGTAGQRLYDFLVSQGLTPSCLNAPLSISVPVISGSGSIGSTLSSTAGQWTNKSSYAVRWQKASNYSGPYTDITGANSSTFQVTSSEADKYIRSSVVATNGNGSSVASVSLPTLVPGTLYVSTSGTVGSGASCASPNFVGSTGAAIQSAINAASANDTIHICEGTYSVSSRLEVTKSLTIEGDGANLSTLDGLGTTQIMMIHDNNVTAGSGSEITVNVSGLGFINGNATPPGSPDYGCGDGTQCGGAIFIERESQFNISDSYFKNNYARFNGGAVARLIGDNLTVPSTITNSTFESNTTIFDGGAISTLWGFGLVIDNSTFYKNKITYRNGSAIMAGGNDLQTLTINNSTFVDNLYTGSFDGIHVLHGGIIVNHSIIAQSSSSMPVACNENQELSGSRGNLVTDNSCSGVTSSYPASPATNSAIVSYADLKLGDLSYRGYANKTIPLFSGSVALNFWTGCSGSDQHGFSRPQGASCDVGAYERPSSQSANALTGWTYASSSLNRANGATASVVTPATNAGSLPVTYASLTTSVCTVGSSTGTVTIVTAGTCNLTATTTGSLLKDQDQLTKSLTIGGVFPPANSTVPLVAGTNRAGISLTSTNGSWTNSPTSYSYQWMSSATSGGTYANISGATASSYELAASDVGRYIRLSVVANNGSGGGAAALSVTRGPVADFLTGVSPELSDPTPTSDGFTVDITNYSNVISYAFGNFSSIFSFTATTSRGSVSLANGVVTVTGLPANGSATVTVSASRAGYATRSATRTGSTVVTTTTTSLTAPVLAPTTTTVIEPSTAVAETIPAPTVAQGQKSVATIAPSTGSTTTVLSPMQNEGVTTTTEAVRIKNSAIPGEQGISEPFAPVAPTVAPGEAGTVIDGKVIETEITRANNALTVTAGNISATVSVKNANGEQIPLTANGDIQVSEGEEFFTTGSGFAPGSIVEVWMMSNPIQLGTTSADSKGKVEGSFEVPSGIESGSHRLVFKGRNADDASVVVAIGISYTANNEGSNAVRILIIVPIVLAALAALLLPAAVRTRRKKIKA